MVDIDFNKLFATHSLAEHGIGFLINIYNIENAKEQGNSELLYKFIFDTGSTNLTYLHNLNIRGYQIYDVNSIVLSHWHYDHTGGLYKILEQVENEIPIICHKFAKYERFFRRSDDIKTDNLIGKTKQEILPLLSSSKIVNQLPINTEKIGELNCNVVFSKDSYELLNFNDLKIVVSGEIPRKHDIEDFSNFFLLKDDILKTDKISDDKCLIFNNKETVILLLGCCHAGIMNTLDYVKSITDKPISHIIGGFHMANASKLRIEKTIKYLKSFQVLKPLYLFPIHCSGEKFLYELIKADDPDLKAFNTSVGTIFNF